MVDQVQLVRTVLVESLVFQVFQDLRELQVNQDDLVFKVTTENPEEVSKEHLVKMDFKDDLVRFFYLSSYSRVKVYCFHYVVLNLNSANPSS